MQNISPLTRIICHPVSPRPKAPKPRSARCSLSAMEREHLRVVNMDRQAHQLPLLKVDCHLMTVARKYSQQMYRDHHFSHEGLDGSTALSRIEAVTHRFRMSAENLFSHPNINNSGYPRSALPFQAESGLMQSPGHRANLLNPNLVFIGIGFYEGPDGRVYLTQNFGGLPKY